MRLTDIDASVFFPGSQITTAFGWDPDPRFGPRVHHAVDRAGAGMVRLPFAAKRLDWKNADTVGNSVLRAFADPGIELRMLHFRPNERTPDLLNALRNGRGLPAGAPLAPAGDVGIGSGRHVHYQLMLDPECDWTELDKLVPGWTQDDKTDWLSRYGLAFALERSRRGIRWINTRALRRADPWTGMDRIIIDSATILGL